MATRRSSRKPDARRPTPPGKKKAIDWAAVELLFWAKVDVQFLPGTPDPDFSKCWLWKGSTGSGASGKYGKVKIAGIIYKAHRIAFRLFYGRKIPDHLDGGHDCDTPPCCNPTHVKPCQHRANVQEWYFRHGKWNGGDPPRPDRFVDLEAS